MRVILLCLLLTSCADTLATGAPAIAFEHDVVDVGGFPAQTEQLLVLRWRRTGSGPLRVLAVESDCGCALASGPHGMQPAGARGEVVVRLVGLRRAGPFQHRVTLYTDQPAPRDAVRVLLRGWVEAPVALAPAALDLGGRSPGAALRRIVEVRLAPVLASALALAPASALASALASTPAGARGAGAAPGPASQRLPRGSLTARVEGVEGSVCLLPPARRDVPGCLLRVTLRTPSVAGAFEARVLLEHAGAVLATLPIRGVVEAGPTPRRSARPGPVPPR